MGVEIERKFLILNDSWRDAHVEPEILRQGYLSTDPDRTVRVRIADDRAWLTVKGRSRGDRRTEIEVAIPAPEALDMLALAKGLIVVKRRYCLPIGGFVWEIDEFVNENSGLVVAELEVGDEADFGRALADPPSWLGRDVTDDVRLSNARLSEHPFVDWTDAERASLVARSS